jgi:hypothetical protein
MILVIVGLVAISCLVLYWAGRGSILGRLCGFPIVGLLIYDLIFGEKGYENLTLYMVAFAMLGAFYARGKHRRASGRDCTEC